MGAKAAFLIRPADLGAGGPGAGLGQLLDPPQQGRLTSFHTVAIVALFMGVWAVLGLRPPTLGPSQAALRHQGGWGAAPAHGTGTGVLRGRTQALASESQSLSEPHTEAPLATRLFASPPALPPQGLSACLRLAPITKQPL